MNNSYIQDPNDIVFDCQWLLANVDTKAYASLVTLIQAMGAKEGGLWNHCGRVGYLTRLICNHMHMDDWTTEALVCGAVLHDVGKIAVANSILLKPSRLTAIEYDIIKSHPGLAVDLLEPLQLPEKTLSAVLHHHEHFDGTGYPYALRGNAIPLGARIISVVDAFDAMTRERIYRQPVTTEAALLELVRCRATQFDPEVVDEFVRYIKNYPVNVAESTKPWYAIVGEQPPVREQRGW